MLYQFKNHETQEVYTLQMRLSELEPYLAKTPQAEIHHTPDTVPLTVMDSQHLMATHKFDSGFKEVLQKIHHETPGSQMGSTSSQL